MSYSSQQIEQLLLSGNKASLARLDDWSRSVSPDVLSHQLAATMRNFRNRRSRSRFVWSAIGVTASLFLISSLLDPLNTPPSAVIAFLAYLLVGIVAKAISDNIRLITGERRAREWLALREDIRALPGLLRGTKRNKPRQGEAIAILNRATAEPLPTTFLPHEQRVLCRTVRRYLWSCSRRLNARTSETDADLFIAALRFLSLRDPNESEMVLRRLAARPATGANAAFVSETAKALLTNEGPRFHAKQSAASEMIQRVRIRGNT